MAAATFVRRVRWALPSVSGSDPDEVEDDEAEDKKSRREFERALVRALSRIYDLHVSSGKGIQVRVQSPSFPAAPLIKYSWGLCSSHI